MTEQEFQSKLAELMGEISTLPPTERKKLETLATVAPQRPVDAVGYAAVVVG